jgi:hypothetical protein
MGVLKFEEPPFTIFTRRHSAEISAECKWLFLKVDPIFRVSAVG